MSKKINFISTSLKINGRVLKRNFYFRTARTANSLNSYAKVRIKKASFEADKITVNENDSLSLYIDDTEVFSGEVSHVSSTENEIAVSAVYRISGDSDCNETFNNITLDRVLSFMGVQTKYHADSKPHDLIICKGKKERTLKRLLEGLYYYMDIDRNLVVKNSASAGKNYIIDGCVCETNGSKISIFPIPNLEINDTVQLENTKYIVKDIVYSLESRYRMILTI